MKLFGKVKLMKISVISRRSFAKIFEEVEGLVERLNGFRFISISGVGEESPVPVEFLAESLLLHFDDIVEEDDAGAFSQADALSIRKFADKAIADKKDLIIHCAAGVSRSGAVGSVLNDYANRYLADNKEDWLFFSQKGCENEIFPNSLVKRILNKALGLSY